MTIHKREDYVSGNGVLRIKVCHQPPHILNAVFARETQGMWRRYSSSTIHSFARSLTSSSHLFMREFPRRVATARWLLSTTPLTITMTKQKYNNSLPLVILSSLSLIKSELIDEIDKRTSIKSKITSSQHNGIESSNGSESSTTTYWAIWPKAQNGWRWLRWTLAWVMGLK